MGGRGLLRTAGSRVRSRRVLGFRATSNSKTRFGLANWRVVVVDTAPLEVVEEQGMQTTGIQAAELHSVRGSPV